ncbi:MAG: response regulator [Rhodospirillales bacterium]
MARILVIDDEPDVRTFIATALIRDGHMVVTAGNGYEGVELYRRDPMDVVITDIFMPDQDGLQTIIQLRKESPDLKIICISGGGNYVLGDYLPAAKRFGANVVLSKPISVSELRHAVNRILSIAK